MLEQEMLQVAAAIQAATRRREALKREMEAWYQNPARGRFPRYQELARVDEALSDLDTHYKLLWDALHSRALPAQVAAR